MRFKGGHHSFEQRCAYRSKTGALRTGMIAEAIERIDSYTAKANALLDKSNQITDSTRGATDDGVYAGALQRLEKVHQQHDSWTAKVRMLSAIPEVHAALVKRQEQAEWRAEV